jgi:hypothetical protein
VRFEITHTFSHSIDVVERTLLDPATTQALAPRMKTIVDVEPIESSEDGDLVTRRVRYVPAPLIKRVCTKKVNPRWMEWVEESEYDRSARRMRFRNIPRIGRIAELLENSGTLQLSETSSGGTRRIVSGEIRVKVRIFGRIAEKIIQKQGLGILEEEARVFAQILAERAAG